ncbi:MAG: dipicolinate synthase subunit B [Clostridiales bacterium]|nr:dipicolinate synthase subunit B [Clostridiales bacterium]
MQLNGIKIGFCVTGSHCTLEETLEQLKRLKEQGADLYPIFSYNVATTDTRFTTAKDFREKVEEVTGKTVVDTIVDAEPFGPVKKMDLMIIVPCTGNTLAKLANAITDTPVLMAAKAHLRNQRPLLLGIATNDGLGNNAKNIGVIINTKNIFMVPFWQDDPIKKPNSLVADLDRLLDASLMALKKEQIQPVIIERKSL